MYNGLFLVLSKVLPIYNPIIPITKIIIPDKNHMEMIRLANPKYLYLTCKIFINIYDSKYY